MTIDWNIYIPEEVLKSEAYAELEKVLEGLDVPAPNRHCQRCWEEGFLTAVNGMAAVASLVASREKPLVFVAIFNKVIDHGLTLLEELPDHTK
jgi:hypothetical protein